MLKPTTAILMVCACGLARADGPAVASLEILPAVVQLDSSLDLQRIVVVATLSDCTTRDVTHEASLETSPSDRARVADGVVRPLADGEAALRASLTGHSASAKVIVRNASVSPPASFRLDVEPSLMRAGCNAGACHGSASGKNGFRLSLFGFDPEADYISLTRQSRGRRLDVANPIESLMLTKPTAAVAHEGGRRLEAGDSSYGALGRWIRQGARNDPPDQATLTAIEVLPRRSLLAGSGTKQQLLVRATYSDGTDRDVTDMALWSTNNDRAAEVNPSGVVTARERGEAFVMVRYGTFAVMSQVIVLPAGLAFTWPDVPEQNYIDALIYKKLRELRITPSPMCSDETFVRRAYIDIIGQLPAIAEFERFMSDATPDKRAKLIDALLARPEFPELWAMKWAELLRIESASLRISFKAMYNYSAWLRDAILKDMPLDQMVRSLLTARGGNFSNPAANFYLVESDPKAMAENVAQVFLGVRVQCAQCHNHPFERWTMDDYYGFAAFFPQVGRKTSEDPRESVVFNTGGGEVNHPRDGRVMQPRALGGPVADLKGRDRREALAEWITAPDNPWFASCMANRVWAHFFGAGIVDPPDDVRVSNPPSHPELYDALGRRFVEYKYDLRRLVRDICNSRTYQLATAANESNTSDDRNFARARVRRMTAEQMLDAVCRVADVPEKFSGLPLGARATQVADGRTGNYFLDAFGRPDRTSACTCDRRNEPTLGQALHLINGATVSEKLRSDGGRAARMVAANAPTDQIVNELYAAALSRRPTADEMSLATKHVNKATDRRQAVEDLFWAVLNSREFLFNH